MATTHFSGAVDSANGFSVNGTVVIDEDGNVDAPITTTDLTTTGNTILGNATTDTTVNSGTFTANAGVIFAGTETIAAGGTTTALSLLVESHLVDADAGGDIFTLADGTIGQQMTIVMASATGVATVTPANLIGGTSVTMNAAGESVTLKFIGTNWAITGGNAYTVI